MKELVIFIKENKYNYHPKNKEELIKIIRKLIKERGNKADLNDIDTSEITNMNDLFSGENIFYKISGEFSNFDGDISKWDVSHVKSMDRMFFKSKFTGENGDISKWNTSNLENVFQIFEKSEFKGNLNKWDVSKIMKKYRLHELHIFDDCPLEKEKRQPKWYKEHMKKTFDKKFYQDLKNSTWPEERFE